MSVVSRTRVGSRWVALLMVVGLVAVAAPAVAEDSSPPWVESAKLTASDAAEGDGLGTSVAISGNTLVASTRAESAYVFTRTGSGWAEVAKLTASDASDNAGFGRSVGISGNTIVVGAPLAGTMSAGAAYVFTRTAVGWVEAAKLTGSDTDDFDQFGASVAMSGNTIVVGARFPDSPAVYVFTPTAVGWAEEARLTGTVIGQYDQFGESVAISGHTIVVGAPFSDVGGPVAGAAVVFTRTPSGWVESAVLTGANEFDLLGREVAISGNTIMSTATGDWEVLRQMYVFTLKRAGWVQTALLTPSDFVAGGPIVMTGDTVVVGAPHAMTEAALVFTRTRAGWAESARFTVAEFEYDYVGFGLSLGISKDTIVGGAPLDDDVGAGAGAVYVFSRR